MINQQKSGKIDPAQRARNFIALNQTGILSTHSRSVIGYPFGSVVPYDLDANGNLIIFVSKISEHFRNLEINPKASLLIADSQGFEDPQPFARTTIIGDFVAIPESDQEKVEAAYWSRFPSSPTRSLAHDFVFLQMTPIRIRWIGGFGDIRWIEGSQYLACATDSVAYHGQSITKHVNEDHQDSLAELVGYYHKLEVTPASCKMNAVSSSGFSVVCFKNGKIYELDFSFPQTAENPNDVRKQIITMLTAARS